MPVGTILTYYCTMASYAVTRNGSDTKKTTMVKSFLLSSANYSPAMKDSVAFPGQTPVISTASGALVVGGVRDIYIYVYIPGDRFECSME